MDMNLIGLLISLAFTGAVAVYIWLSNRKLKKRIATYNFERRKRIQETLEKRLGWHQKK